VNVPGVSEAVLESEPVETGLEAVFLDQYGRLARLISSITRDPGRAEELAVEVFLKWSASGPSRTSEATGWLHRTAVRMALDELRRRTRRERLDRWFQMIRHPLTPEEIQLANDRQSRVADVLSKMKRREAEILLLRADGMSYEALAKALSLSPTSIGTVLSRAQDAFRKEYIRRYGKTE
jgi:RNA polymerase sigma-70 factor, ECF subfamily